MKKTIYFSFLLFLCLSFVQTIDAQTNKNRPKEKTTAAAKANLLNNTSIQKEIEMFPSPNDNQNRFVIKLPKKSQEDNYRVGIVVGKNMMTDGCNSFIISSTAEEKTLDGWGYTYYLLNEMIVVATQMACLDNKKQTKFVHTPTQLLRYNSKLPIVLYVPKDAIVKYTIWTGNQPVAAMQLN